VRLPELTRLGRDHKVVPLHDLSIAQEKDAEAVPGLDVQVLEMIDSFVEDHRPARERFQNLEFHDVTEKTVDLLGDSLTPFGRLLPLRHPVCATRLSNCDSGVCSN
jgi:hypothetical protein